MELDGIYRFSFLLSTTLTIAKLASTLPIELSLSRVIELRNDLISKFLRSPAVIEKEKERLLAFSVLKVGSRF